MEWNWIRESPVLKNKVKEEKRVEFEKVVERWIMESEVILDEGKKENPVTRTWHIPKTETGVVWCDAHSIAMGIVVEIVGLVAEDAS